MRRFEGWEPKTVTRHKYRRCRQMSCDGCGGWLPDTTLGEVEDWDVPPPWRCKRCTAIAYRQEVYAEKNKHVHATRWTAERRHLDGEPHRLG
jgi:hypothetical protein